MSAVGIFHLPVRLITLACEAAAAAAKTNCDIRKRALELCEHVSLQVDITGIFRCQMHRDEEFQRQSGKRMFISARKRITPILRDIDRKSKPARQEKAYGDHQDVAKRSRAFGRDQPTRW